MGHVDDIGPLWAGSHIAALPSYREGLPKALLEAAACGKPLVATDVPGCREVVEDGFNGLLVEPKAAEPLADAIAALAGDPARRQVFGERSRQRVEAEFAEPIVIAQTLQLYEGDRASADVAVGPAA